VGRRRERSHVRVSGRDPRAGEDPGSDDGNLDGLQNQSVLYVAEALEAEPRVLVDPNTFSSDGTIALSMYEISEDGKYIAYGIAEAGSDWEEFKVRNVTTGKDLADHLKWIKFSDASWTPDGKGFYYERFDEPEGDKLQTANYYQKVYYHRLGASQDKDRLVYHRPDKKEWGFSSTVTEDGRYLILTIDEGTSRENRIYYQDLGTNDGKTVKLLDDFDAQYRFVGNDGPLFWFTTDLDAPRGRVIAIDTRRPDRKHWRELIPESEDALEHVSVIGDMFVAGYLHDAYDRVRIFALDGRHVRDLELPGIGRVRGFTGRRADTETFYAYTSFNVPEEVYHYDMVSGKSTIFRRPSVDFGPEAFVTRQVFYESKDGTKVPMFICHLKSLKLDGDNPTYLYGYGGFNVPLKPRFSISRLVWMEMGGVYAVANLRGGGEYGKEWHDAGKLENKQNTFDDFHAAAEWLIANKYTNSKKLAISGASNGGTLVGACMTQRPELYGAALPDVGVMDMLRFHKFTIGWAWTSDYGSPDDPEQFKTLYAYSPLHNLKPGTCYPATLVTTADHDDRVVPSHSFKFIARLQEVQSCANPVLIRIETKAGHGAGKPTAKLIEELADTYGFLTRVFEMDTSGLGSTSRS
jgi:prolyl oligopeptidase